MTEPIVNMIDELRRPANLVTLETALVVSLMVRPKTKNLSFTTEEWLDQLSSPNHLLTLRTDKSLDETLTDFHNFHSGSGCRSIVVWTDTIHPFVNMIAYHGLEFGYRVFLIVRDLGTNITPAVLRLSHAGVTVMSVDDFEAETTHFEKQTESAQ